MMITTKKGLILLVFAITSLMANAQQDIKLDGEMIKLVNLVKTLRTTENSQNQESKFNIVIETLISDNAWTPMNELIDEAGGECSRNEWPKNFFKLNRALNNAEKIRAGKTDMPMYFLNGEDAKYNYSLFEKSVKPGKKVRYTVKGRYGRQQWVIMPFDTTLSRLDVSIYYDGEQIKAKQEVTSDGIFIDSDTIPLPIGSKITIEIVNSDKKNAQAFAIFNYNQKDIKK